MKKIIAILVFLSGLYANAYAGPLFFGGGGASLKSTAIPSSGTLTTAMHSNYELDDTALTAATDVQLLAISDKAAKFWIYVAVGDYTISLVPPSGEKLRMPDASLLDANDEIDLSSAEGDCFCIKRAYSDSEAAWVWEVYEIRGVATDGGTS